MAFDFPEAYGQYHNLPCRGVAEPIQFQDGPALSCYASISGKTSRLVHAELKHRASLIKFLW